MSDYVMIVHNNKIFKIRCSPNETVKNAFSRAWQIALDTSDKSLVEKECESLMTHYEKTLGVEY